MYSYQYLFRIMFIGISVLLVIAFFNLFNPKFLKKAFLSLNLDTAIVTKHVSVVNHEQINKQ